jgi:hypothetical protein
MDRPCTVPHVLLPLALLLSCAARGAVQPNPYTADQIERLLRGGVHAEKILVDARRECIAFRIAPEIAQAFARAGAPPSFVQELGGICYRPLVRR